MKLLLLNPPSLTNEQVVRDTLYGCWHKTKANYLWPPLNLMGIGSYIIQNKIIARGDVSILDCQAEHIKLPKLVEFVKKSGPSIIAIITDGLTFKEDLQILSSLKKENDFLSILMGNIPTLYPDRVLLFNEVDFIVRGEPELTFGELVKAIKSKTSLEKIKGVSYKKNGKIFNNPDRPALENLDMLPFPELGLINFRNYQNPLSRKKYFATIFSSRGCPFQCTFCTSKLVYGGRFRARSAKNVVNEIEQMYESKKISDFFFRDENFTLDKKRVAEICAELQRRKLKIYWMCNSRVDTIDEPLLKLMKNAGCYLIKFGVESSSQRILDIIKKGTRVKKIVDAFELCRKYKINTVAHIMVGSPGDTAASIEDTINFVSKLKPTYASFDITIPYPGTQIFNQLVKEKKISMASIEKDFNVEKLPISQIMTGLSEKQVNALYRKAFIRFYLNPGFILREIFSPRMLRNLKSNFKSLLQIMGK